MEPVGDLDYMPPEMLMCLVNPGEKTATYGLMVDVWQAGVFVYNVLEKKCPFTVRLRLGCTDRHRTCVHSRFVAKTWHAYRTWPHFRFQKGPRFCV